MRREFSIDIASSIAKNLAIVHRETHVAKLNKEKFSVMEKEFQYVMYTHPITKTCPCNIYFFSVPKIENFTRKMLIFFLFLLQT